MAARKVINYATTDGQLHETRRAADIHQAKIDAAAEVHKCLLSSLTTARPTAIVGEMLLNVDTLLPILAAYKKKAKQGIDKLR